MSADLSDDLTPPSVSDLLEAVTTAVKLTNHDAEGFRWRIFVSECDQVILFYYLRPNSVDDESNPDILRSIRVQPAKKPSIYPGAKLIAHVFLDSADLFSDVLQSIPFENPIRKTDDLVKILDLLGVYSNEKNWDVVAACGLEFVCGFDGYKTSKGYRDEPDTGSGFMQSVDNLKRKGFSYAGFNASCQGSLRNTVDQLVNAIDMRNECCSSKTRKRFYTTPEIDNALYELDKDLMERKLKGQFVKELLQRLAIFAGCSLTVLIRRMKTQRKTDRRILKNKNWNKTI